MKEELIRYWHKYIEWIIENNDYFKNPRRDDLIYVVKIERAKELANLVEFMDWLKEQE